MAEKFHIAVMLANGERIESDVSLEDAQALPPVPRKPDKDDWWHAGSAVYSALLHRLQKGQGQLLLRDKQGNIWVIQATSIIGASFADPREKEAQPFGFRPIEAEIDDPKVVPIRRRKPPAE